MLCLCVPLLRHTWFLLLRKLPLPISLLTNSATAKTKPKADLLFEVFPDPIFVSQAKFSVLPWYSYDSLEKLTNGFSCL